MSNRRTFILAALAALVLAGVAPSPASDPTAAAHAPQMADGALARAPGTTLSDIAVQHPADGAPAVTLRGDGPLSYQSFVLENPNRLVLDLKGVSSKLRAPQVSVGSGGVVRVRAGQFRHEPDAVARVVIDLEGPRPFRIERRDDGLDIVFESDARASLDVAPAADEALPADEGTEVTEDPVTEALAASALAVSRAPEPAEAAPSRALPADALESLLSTPPLAAPADPAPTAKTEWTPGGSFETKTITTSDVRYNGKKISLNLVDADVKQVFRLFHEISGLNFVLDPSVEGRVTIVLDNVPWDQALDIILNNNGLDKSLENNVIRIATTQKLALEAASRRQLKEAKELEVEPITITRTLSYAKAKEVERVIRDGGVLSPRGKVIVDDRTNTLIISDIPKKVDPLDELISTLDSETPQVMIEARIVETSRSFVQDFGVKWGANVFADAAHGTALGTTFPHNASVQYGLNLPGNSTASTLAFKFGNILDSFTLDVALNALENEGRGRILSSPKIATQNNERAEIEQGVRIPIVNTTATEINVEFVSASLRLSVTPQITAEATIILDIQVENNSPDFVNRVGTTPPINTQRATTKVLISDGGTTVIGGIFTVNESTSEVGVPWFRKIPVFGWLFKARNITTENRELLIFITPKIMRVG